MKEITYRSTNGYSGILYGMRSMSIYNADNKLVFHTGRRNGDTMDYLQKMVEGYPEFLKMLRGEK